MTGRPRRCRMPCRVEHRQPPLVGEGLGRCPPRVTHQALELLTRRFDVGPVDRVRLPAPAVAVVGQPDGPAAREDGDAPRRHLVEAGRFVPIDEHPAAQLPARPMLTSPSVPVRVSRASVRRVPSGAVHVGRPVCHERPAVLDQLALDGVRRVVRRLETGPVGGVEGLDADGAGPVCRVSGALHPPQVRCAPRRPASRRRLAGETDPRMPRPSPRPRSPSCHWTPPFGGTAAVMARAAISSS